MTKKLISFVLNRKISVRNVTKTSVTLKPKIDGQTFRLIFLAQNIRTNECEPVTKNHFTQKPNGVYIIRNIQLKSNIDLSFPRFLSNKTSFDRKGILGKFSLTKMKSIKFEHVSGICFGIFGQKSIVELRRSSFLTIE